jgi:uncharacterized protein involved in type VI secretion and phage assembly
MKILIAPIVIGMLALAGASPAAAQSKSVPDKGTSVGMAASSDSEADRKSYTQQAQGEMQLWEQRLHDFNAKVEANATDTQTNASKDLDGAWTKTKTAWNQLETAGENDWTSAKSSFQDASHRLGLAWQKVNPKDK